jgi:hypothetical protein
MSLTNIQKLEASVLRGLGTDYDAPALALAAKDMIDAGTNVLCRLEGARSAATFAFALSDRMVASVLGQPTEAPIYLPSISPEMPRPDPGKPVGKFPGFAPGYLAGFLMGIVVGFVAGRAL